jgi:hypothetical protein
MWDEGRLALEAGERYAEGQASEDDVQSAGRAAILAGRGITRNAYATLAAGWTCLSYSDHRYMTSVSDFDGGFTASAQYALHAVQATDDAGEAFRELAENVRRMRAGQPGLPVRNEQLLVAERAVQVALFRCIFGNPFCPVSLSPAWLTPAVLKLAQAAYDDRLLPSGLLDNTRLAVLADALEEGGCSNADLLSHLRGPGPHVRGCWALDLVLGKE